MEEMLLALEVGVGVLEELEVSPSFCNKVC